MWLRRVPVLRGLVRFFGLPIVKSAPYSCVYEYIMLNLETIVAKITQKNKGGVTDLFDNQVDDFAWDIDAFYDLAICNMNFNLFVCLGCRDSINFTNIWGNLNFAT